MLEKSLLKYYEELNLLDEGVLVLAEEKEDRYINKVIPKIEPHIDIFLVNTFQKDHLAYDNVYSFSLKDFKSFSAIKYEMIQNNNPYDSLSINKVIRYWEKVKTGGVLALTLIDKNCVSEITRLINFTPEMWSDKDGVAVYRKESP
tara:strand:- start:662 stop:1099 length:438 start_codon:yes stop_codon:yes gene_type:complete